MLLRSLQRRQAGFTLIEVMISLGLILILAAALASLLRGNLDMREALSQRAKVLHRANGALTMLVQDLQHTFIIDENDQMRYGDTSKRKVKTLFKIDLRTDSDEAWFTHLNHKPLLANSNESDASFVVYKLKDLTNSGRLHLYRGETERIPESFKEEPKMKLIAKNIKSLTMRAWRGDQWSKDLWDSSRREFRGKLPAMVSVNIEAYDIDELEEETKSDLDKAATFSLNTVVYLPLSFGIPELKTPATTIRWDKFGEKID